jgi:CheY-like chemotaxis protein
VTAKPVKPIKLLLVEDSPAEILLIRQVLARESVPVSLHVAVDGKQASEILAAGQFKPDLVLLDLNLPKLSGLSVLEHCRPHVPVVVFSSSISPDDIQRSFQLGVRDFVPKPSDLESYRRVVSYIVHTWGAKDSAAKFAG